VVDTSGSVSGRALNHAWAETLSCLRQLGVRRDLLTVFAVDAAATRISKPYSRRIELTGGGGTDMGVGIEAACRLRPLPSLIVVLTDGFTPWPAEAPRTRVVVALLGSAGHDVDTPPWATTVRIDVDDVSIEP
jgi:predicted metal-dependent peptidase